MSTKENKLISPNFTVYGPTADDEPPIPGSAIASRTGWAIYIQGGAHSVDHTKGTGIARRAVDKVESSR